MTIVSFVFGCICGYYATQRNWTYSLVFWGLNRLFDGLDGSVARVSGQQSDFGGYFGALLCLCRGLVASPLTILDFSLLNRRYRDGFYRVQYRSHLYCVWRAQRHSLARCVVSSWYLLRKRRLLDVLERCSREAISRSQKYVLPRYIALKSSNFILWFEYYFLFCFSFCAGRGELTTVTMPPGLIGGFETVIFFSCFLIFPQYATHLFFLMGFMVCLTIVQRLFWARSNLDKKK